MTITPHYIRKCEMAEEIQAMRAPIPNGDGYYDLQLGDFFSINKKINIFGLIHEDRKTDRCLCCMATNGKNVRVEYALADHGDVVYVNKIIWLPRLDQLFDIANGVEISANKAFMFMVAENKEEILLTVIMRNKFGKKWNGDNWESVK